MTPHQMESAEIAVNELLSGGYLIETRSEAGDWYNYRVSSGRIISEHVIKKLTELRVIEPSGDGLFGDSQSYRLVAAPRKFDDYCCDLWGDGWAVLRANSKKAKAIAGQAVRKSDFDEAKRLFDIAGKAWAQ
jgi:hypothetical protein